MAITIEEVHQLHKNGLHSNLKKLLSFMLSLPEFSTAVKEDYYQLSKQYQLHIYYGESLYEEECYKKAEVVFSDALKYHKSLSKLKSKETSKEANLTSEVEVRYKIYLCLMKLQDYRQALTTLENISPKQRTIKINMKLGKLYQKHGMERSAITCYKEVLRSSSIALEAACCLIRLGISVQEISSLLNNSNSTSPEWLLQYLKAYSFGITNKHTKALQIYKNLEIQTFRDNATLLCAMGESYYRCGDNSNSMISFQKARLRDKLCFDKMDIYAQVLSNETEKKELEKLAQDLMGIDQTKTESWVAMSLYCAATREETKAVYFAQKAHMLDSTNIQALILKASLLQSLDKQQEAIIHYREAIRLSPNQLEPYEGLVDCYLSIEKQKDALNVARNAHKTIGANARTLTLCGQAYYQVFQTQDKAKVLLKKALSLDGKYLPAVYLLAGIYIKEENYDDALAMLTKQLENNQTAKLYQLSGDCYKGLGDNQKGLEQYSKSLRLDPKNLQALDGIESVEGLGTSELDISTIGMHEPRHRSSMEDLDALSSDWMP